MTTEKDVKEYMRTHFKSSWERTDFIRKINIELQEVDYEIQKEYRGKQQEMARKKRERQDSVGQEMKKIVKPGMVVKCRGTKDGQGIREVMEVNEYGIIARKVTMEMREYFRDSYITEHYWNKVMKVLDIEISE